MDMLIDALHGGDVSTTKFAQPGDDSVHQPLRGRSAGRYTDPGHIREPARVDVAAVVDEMGRGTAFQGDLFEPVGIGAVL